jgi:hypothetical protein
LATMIAFALVPAASTSIFAAITPNVVETCSGVNPSLCLLCQYLGLASRARSSRVYPAIRLVHLAT